MLLSENRRKLKNAQRHAETKIGKSKSENRKPKEWEFGTRKAE
jgi:hypothetical protein